MQQTNVRIGAHDHLTVELENQAKHTVSRRVLGAKVDGEALDVLITLGHI